MLSTLSFNLWFASRNPGTESLGVFLTTKAEFDEQDRLVRMWVGGTQLSG